MSDHLVEGRQLSRQPPAQVEGEGRAVEHLIILGADHVEIDERHLVLDHPCHHVGKAQILLAAVIGRAVGHDQDLRTALGERFGHVRVPGVLADRKTDPHRPDRHRPRDRPRGEVAAFVEHFLVGQVVLVHHRLHPAAGEDPVTVVEPAVLGMGAADGDGGPVAGDACQRRHLAGDMGNEGRPQHEIARLVAGKEHLRQDQEIRTRRPGLFMGGPDLVGIAGNVAHGRVELGKGDAKALGHRPSSGHLARAARRTAPWWPRADEGPPPSACS